MVYGLGFSTSTAVAWVQFLVWEVGLHLKLLHSVAKERKAGGGREEGRKREDRREEGRKGEPTLIFMT